MKLISIFYFINCRLVIALNMCFGALNVALRGIQIREFPMILSRGGDTEEELDFLPCLENGIQERSQKQPDFGG